MSDLIDSQSKRKGKPRRLKATTRSRVMVSDDDEEAKYSQEDDKVQEYPLTQVAYDAETASLLQDLNDDLPRGSGNGNGNGKKETGQQVAGEDTSDSDGDSSEREAQNAPYETHEDDLSEDEDDDGPNEFDYNDPMVAPDEDVECEALLAEAKNDIVAAMKRLSKPNTDPKKVKSMQDSIRKLKGKATAIAQELEFYRKRVKSGSATYGQDEKYFEDAEKVKKECDHVTGLLKEHKKLVENEQQASAPSKKVSKRLRRIQLDDPDIEELRATEDIPEMASTSSGASSSSPASDVKRSNKKNEMQGLFDPSIPISSKGVNDHRRQKEFKAQVEVEPPQASRNNNNNTDKQQNSKVDTVLQSSTTATTATTVVTTNVPAATVIAPIVASTTPLETQSSVPSSTVPKEGKGSYLRILPYVIVAHPHMSNSPTMMHVEHFRHYHYHPKLMAAAEVYLNTVKSLQDEQKTYSPAIATTTTAAVTTPSLSAEPAVPKVESKKAAAKKVEKATASAPGAILSPSPPRPTTVVAAAPVVVTTTTIPTSTEQRHSSVTPSTVQEVVAVQTTVESKQQVEVGQDNKIPPLSQPHQHQAPVQGSPSGNNSNTTNNNNKRGREIKGKPGTVDQQAEALAPNEKKARHEDDNKQPVIRPLNTHDDTAIGAPSSIHQVAYTKEGMCQQLDKWFERVQDHWLSARNQFESAEAREVMAKETMPSIMVCIPKELTAKQKRLDSEIVTPSQRRDVWATTPSDPHEYLTYLYVLLFNMHTVTTQLKQLFNDARTNSRETSEWVGEVGTLQKKWIVGMKSCMKNKMNALKSASDLKEWRAKIMDPLEEKVSTLCRSSFSILSSTQNPPVDHQCHPQGKGWLAPSFILFAGPLLSPAVKDELKRMIMAIPDP